jgi:hypothetical protein
MNKNIRNFLHYFITFYSLFGGLITSNCKWLQIHFIFNTLILLHWLTNNNRCFLSEYDYKENAYTAQLLNKLGINIYDNKTALMLAPYILLFIPMMITYYKLNQFKCSFTPLKI